MEKKQIDSEAVALMSARGFDNAYFRMLGKDGIENGRQAWEAVEAAYAEYFGKNKYKNYESFTMAKNRRLKK